jgi:hypothetical protein
LITVTNERQQDERRKISNFFRVKTTWNIGVAKLTNAESCSSSRISRPNDVFFFLRKVNPCTVGGGGGTYSAWQMKIFCSDSLSLSRRREFSHFE